MNYEIITLEEKIVVGVSAITSNNDPKMGEIIGGLWDKLYNDKDGVSAEIKNKIDQLAIGLYSDYAGGVDGEFCATAGNQVSKAENDNLTVKIIPAGKYAKFFVQGNMQKAVAEAWREIWQLPLERTFTGDFEEYLNCDFENADINIYIAIK